MPNIQRAFYNKDGPKKRPGKNPALLRLRVREKTHSAFDKLDERLSTVIFIFEAPFVVRSSKRERIFSPPL